MEIVYKLKKVKHRINQELKGLEKALSTVEDALSKNQECAEEDMPNAVDKLLLSCRSVKDVNNSLSQGMGKVLSLFNFKMQWHPNVKEMMPMIYHEGNSPWSIWLSYNPTPSCDGLFKILKDRYKKGLLKKLEIPRVGDFALCYYNKMVFRALIIDISMRIKVINIDNYSVKLLKLDACFEMDWDLYKYHTYSIHCCLTKDRRYEKLWNKDLGHLFKNILKESHLTMRIVEELPSVPPLFLVDMHAFNKALDVETDLSQWITKSLFPELKGLPVDDTLNNLDHLSDQALDPFILLSDLPKCDSDILSGEMGRDQSNLPCLANSTVDSSSLSLEEKPRNRLAHLVRPRSGQADVFIINDVHLSNCLDKNLLPPEAGAEVNSFTSSHTNSASLSKDSINTLNLPSIGSMVTLKVTHIVGYNTFYAYLPVKILDDNGEVCETLQLLNDNINSSEGKRDFKQLIAPPWHGQLILAYCSAQALWLRAVVKDVFDNNIVQVFYVDYGATEELSLEKCRYINPEFRQVPYQAVHCTLANVFLTDSMEKDAKTFLVSLLLDKKIEAQIMDRDFINNRLEVVAFINCLSVNQMMIEEGFCLPFRRSCSQ